MDSVVKSSRSSSFAAGQFAITFNAFMWWVLSSRRWRFNKRLVFLTSRGGPTISVSNVAPPTSAKVTLLGTECNLASLNSWPARPNQMLGRPLLLLHKGWPTGRLPFVGGSRELVATRCRLKLAEHHGHEGEARVDRPNVGKGHLCLRLRPAVSRGPASQCVAARFPQEYPPPKYPPLHRNPPAPRHKKRAQRSWGAAIFRTAFWG